MMAKAYFADGKILKNDGFGWKLHAKCKEGIDPSEVYRKAVDRQREFLSSNPEYAEYRSAMMAAAGLSKRWKLQAAIELMPDDPDGVWSEVCDGYGDNVSCDLDEVCELCRLYKSALAEKQRRKPVTVEC